MIRKLRPKHELAALLEKMRTARNLTQHALGELMVRESGKSVTQGEVARWESAEVTPNDSTVAMWATALGVPVSTFYEPPDEASLDEWGLARVRAVEKLIDLLNGDQETFRLLAQARADLSRAALLEVEKAPTRSGDVTAPTREILRMAWDEWRALDRAVARRPPEGEETTDLRPGGGAT